MRRADRHRRPGDGPGGREEPRVRRGGDLAVGVPRRRRRRSPTGGFTLARAARARRARVRGRSPTYDVAVAELVRRAGLDAGRAWWPEFAGLALRLRRSLRYGENPHQARRAVRRPGRRRPGWRRREQLHGKEMSYNNYVDADAAWRTAHDFAEPAVAIIKHANPCGIAVGADVAEAHRKAHACDPVSAFGGVIAANGPVTVELAKQIADIFTEVVVAPSYVEGAVEVLAAKKNIRLLRAPACAPLPAEWRQVSGGVLVQMRDADRRARRRPVGVDSWRLASRRRTEVLADLAFAWRAVRSVKSNAILLASGGATVGVGMGQVNRVDSARLAVARAGDRAAGLGGRLRRVLPVPGRPAGADRGRRAGGRAAGRLGARRRGDRRGGVRRRDACTSPEPGTSTTEPARASCSTGRGPPPGGGRTRAPPRRSPPGHPPWCRDPSAGRT